jgi:hypothetical protein
VHRAGTVRIALAGLTLALCAGLLVADTAWGQAAPAASSPAASSPAASAAEPASIAEPVTQWAHDSVSGLTLQVQGAWVQVVDGQGQRLRRWSAPHGVVTALVHPARRSFLVAPRGLAQLWEVALDPQAPPLYEGLVHDYRMGEGLARPGYLGLRRMLLPRPLQAVCGCGDRPYLRVWDSDPAGSAVLQLDVRRIIARCPAEPHLLHPRDSGSAPSASHPGCGCPACPPR